MATDLILHFWLIDYSKYGAATVLGECHDVCHIRCHNCLSFLGLTPFCLPLWNFKFYLIFYWLMIWKNRSIRGPAQDLLNKYMISLTKALRLAKDPQAEGSRQDAFQAVGLFLKQTRNRTIRLAGKILVTVVNRRFSPCQLSHHATGPQTRES